MCRVLLVQAVAGEVLFDRGEEAGCFNGVGEEEGGTNADEDG